MFNYGVKALFVGGASPYSWLFEQMTTNSIQNVLSTDISLIYPRSDIMGWDGGGNQEQVDRPRVQFAFTYLPVSGYNENNVGFIVGLNVPALNNLNTERNYYITANDKNQDAFSYSGVNPFVLALGNCALTRYEFSAAVGRLTTATVTTEALNLLIQTGSIGQILPAIDKQTAAAVTGLYTLGSPIKAVGDFREIQPGSINISFDTGSAFGAILSGNNTCPIQSFNFAIDVPRLGVKDLGWAYPSNRPVTWPITVNIQAEACLNGVQRDALNKFNCIDSGYNFTVQFKNTCTAYDNYSFIFQGAKLNGQTLAARVGNSDTVSFNWSLKINDINRFGSGNPNFQITSTPPNAYSSIIFPQVLASTGSTGALTINLGTDCYLQVIEGAGFMSGNFAFFPDMADVARVRATVSGSTEYQDIGVTVY